MAAFRRSGEVIDDRLHGAARIVRNVETARFQRSLAGLTGVGSPRTAAADEVITIDREAHLVGGPAVCC